VHAHLNPLDSYISDASSGAFSEATLSIRTAGLLDMAAQSEARHGQGLSHRQPGRVDLVTTAIG
jgi:hypothetical protein